LSYKEQIKIGIIGGKGRMGNWFWKLFEAKGFHCLISDMGTELSNIDIAKSCNFIMVATPMEVFEDVIKEIAPHIKENAFLTDICSLKSTQVTCMLNHTNCSVAGTHPLFGPFESYMKRLRFALCPGRGEAWFGWWENFLRENGAFTIMLSPEMHDKYMAVIQALNHMILLSLGATICQDDLDPKILHALSTPSFEKQLETMLRLIPQDPKLYSRIQIDNPFTLETLKNFKQNFETLYSFVSANNDEEFIEQFKEVQEKSQKFLKTPE